VRVLDWKTKCKSEGLVEREMGRNWVLEELKLTRFDVPQLEMHPKSELRETEVESREKLRAEEEGREEKEVDL